MDDGGLITEAPDRDYSEDDGDNSAKSVKTSFSLIAAGLCVAFAVAV